MRIFYSLIILLLLAAPALTWGATSLPWSTTYNCAEWTQSDGEGVGAVNCATLEGYGSWTCDNGDETVEEEQITTPANYPSGDGGRGQRSWHGDGTNNGSGGLSVTFDTVQPEIWVRWYMRFQADFTWSGLTYDKLLYIRTENWQTNGNDAAIVEWYNMDQFVAYAQGDGGDEQANTCTNCGWTTTMGGSTGDGAWHLYEVHLKMDTDGTDGISEAWIDENQIYSHNTVNWGGVDAGWIHVLISSNQTTPNNGSCNYVDYDDVAINSTGYIGPLAGVVGTEGRTSSSGDIDELGW